MSKPLRLTFLALGSRGDVQPFVALGHALQAHGHRVCIATEAEYLDLAQQHGLATACVGGSIREQMDFELVYQALEVADNPLPLGFALSFLKQVGPLVRRIVADSYAACEGADGIVASSLGRYPAYSVAEKLRVPLLPVHFHPFTPTRTMPDLSFPDWPIGLGRGPYRALTHVLAAHSVCQFLRPALNRARREVLGLADLNPLALWAQTRQPARRTLYAYSPHVAPPPTDWTPREVITGYWFLPPAATWQPPAELQAFLEDGPPPLYIGFGSLLAGRNPEGVTRLVLDALTMSGQRGVLYAGWDDWARSPLPPTCVRIESVPHTWLFPRMAAVVTHGGAGTVAAALHAGTPIIGIPFFGDQVFWSQRVHALGAGTAPIPRRALTSSNLAAAIGQVIANPTFRQGAQTLSHILRGEGGVQHGVRWVEDFFEARDF